MGDFTLFEALAGGAFDRLNWQHSGKFDQNFSKKSNASGFARGGWAVLELTGTLIGQEKWLILVINRVRVLGKQRATQPSRNFSGSTAPWELYF